MESLVLSRCSDQGSASESSDIYNYIIDIILKRKPYDKNIEHFFENKIIDPNYENGLLVIYCAFYGNAKMLKLFKKYNADLNIRDHEALLIASQNGFYGCTKILLDDCIDIEQFKYTSSYRNLLKYK